MSSGKQRPDPGGRAREFFFEFIYLFIFFYMSVCVIFRPGTRGGREGGGDGIIERNAGERLAPSALPCHFSFYRLPRLPPPTPRLIILITHVRAQTHTHTLSL